MAPVPYQNGYGSTPAPVCQIELSWRGNRINAPALVDSGASGTLIPRFVVVALGLTQFGERRVSGVFGPQHMAPLYRVDLDFLGFAVQALVVTAPPPAQPDRAYVLVGRDILNRYTTTLSGPLQHFSVQ
jgi:predicted aspartyl protease